MSDLIKAAEDVKLLAKRFKPVLDLAEALEAIGSLDQASKEAKERQLKAYADSDEAAKELSRKQFDLKAIDLAIGEANQKHADTIHATEDEVKLIIVKAQDQAKAIVDAAHVKKAQVSDEVKALREEADKHSAMVKAAHDEHMGIKSQILELKNKLSSFAKL